MSDGGVTQQAPTVFSSKERAALVAKALSEAARRARFSTKRRRGLTQTGFRARKNEQLFRLLRVLSFLVLFVIPIVVGGVYLWLVATDQYIAEARFTVRGGMPPSMDKMGAMTGAPSMLIVQDTQVIMNYLESRAVVGALNRTVGMQKVYSGNDVDWFSRLDRNEPIEKITRFWKRHVDIKLAMPAGIVSFTVRAFKPEDAVALANGALESSEQLVNRMNDQMRDDALSLAETERQRAQDNLAKARAALEQSRNDEGILDTSEASKSLSELLTDIKGNQYTLQQQYDAQRRFVDANAPQLRNLQAKISAAGKEIAKLENQMTLTKGGIAPGGGEKVLSGSMSRLAYANLESTIAEKLYASALAGLEQTKLASETKLMYINIFVHPVAAEEATYPRRWLDMSLIVGGALAAWLAVFGVLLLVRTRMP